MRLPSFRNRRTPGHAPSSTSRALWIVDNVAAVVGNDVRSPTALSPVPEDPHHRGGRSTSGTVVGYRSGYRLVLNLAPSAAAAAVLASEIAAGAAAAAGTAGGDGGGSGVIVVTVAVEGPGGGESTARSRGLNLLADAVDGGVRRPGGGGLRSHCLHHRPRSHRLHRRCSAGTTIGVAMICPFCRVVLYGWTRRYCPCGVAAETMTGGDGGRLFERLSSLASPSGPLRTPGGDLGFASGPHNAGPFSPVPSRSSTRRSFALPVPSRRRILGLVLQCTQLVSSTNCSRNPAKSANTQADQVYDAIRL